MSCISAAADILLSKELKDGALLCRLLDLVTAADLSRVSAVVCLLVCLLLQPYLSRVHYYLICMHNATRTTYSTMLCCRRERNSMHTISSCYDEFAVHRYKWHDGILYIASEHDVPELCMVGRKC